jgi:hypothetical protein
MRVLTWTNTSTGRSEPGPPGSCSRLCPDRARPRGSANVLQVTGCCAPSVTNRLIERFIQHPPPGRAVPDKLVSLTPRELDVRRAVARGLSNAEIVASLYLSEARATAASRTLVPVRRSCWRR